MFCAKAKGVDFPEAEVLDVALSAAGAVAADGAAGAGGSPLLVFQVSHEQEPVRATSANILFKSAGNGASDVVLEVGNSSFASLLVVVLLLLRVSTTEEGVDDGNSETPSVAAAVDAGWLLLLEVPLILAVLASAPTEADCILLGLFSA